MDLTNTEAAAYPSFSEATPSLIIISRELYKKKIISRQEISTRAKAILLHELGHITLKHSLKKINLRKNIKSSYQSIRNISAAISIISLTTVGAKNPMFFAGCSLFALSLAIPHIYKSKISPMITRKHEREADECAMLNIELCKASIKHYKKSQSFHLKLRETAENVLKKSLDPNEVVIESDIKLAHKILNTLDLQGNNLDDTDHPLYSERIQTLEKKITSF